MTPRDRNLKSRRMALKRPAVGLDQGFMEFTRRQNAGYATANPFVIVNCIRVGAESHDGVQAE
jgi:hypothetical protein